MAVRDVPEIRDGTGAKVNPLTRDPSRSAHRDRVIWTDNEKAAIISDAADLQANHPNLAGLRLLRAAIAAMPHARRRKLVAVTQAAWFEPMFAEELRRRAALQQITPA